MPVISVSNKGGTSVDCSDMIAIKKQQILRASQSTKEYYKQIENKSFGSDNISNLFWKNCSGTCSTIGDNNTPLPIGTFTFKTNKTNVLFLIIVIVNENATLTNAKYNGSSIMPVPVGSPINPTTYTLTITDTNQPVTISGLRSLRVLSSNNSAITSLNVSGLTSLDEMDFSQNLFPTQSTINNIVAQLPANPNIYICIILDQLTGTFVQPSYVPAGWNII